MKKSYLELAFWIALSFILLIAMIAGWFSYNQIVYGDWTCGFKKCVIVKEEE